MLVKLIRDALKPEQVELYESDNPIKTLTEIFTFWPENVRLYIDQVKAENDVTPTTKSGMLHDRIRMIQSCNYKELIVLNEYRAPAVIAWAAFIIAVGSAVYALTNKPKMPELDTSHGGDQGSSNNLLSERGNKARTNGRIPDIYGTVKKSYADLLVKSFSVFDNNRQIEYSFMAIGRGDYDVSDVKSGEIAMSTLRDVSVKIYGSNSSPNEDTPTHKLLIGDDFTETVKDVYEIENVSGKELYKTPVLFLDGSLKDKLAINHTNSGGHQYYLEVVGGAQINFYDLFNPTRVIDENTPPGPSGRTYIDIRSSYINGNLILFGSDVDILSETQAKILYPITGWDIDIPLGVNPLLRGAPNYDIVDCVMFLYRSRIFDYEFKGDHELIFNFIAEQGFYKDDGKNIYSHKDDISIVIAFSSGAPTKYVSFYFKSPSLSRDSFAMTKRFNVPSATAGTARVFITRGHDRDQAVADFNFGGNVVDTIKIHSIFVRQEIEELKTGSTPLLPSPTGFTKTVGKFGDMTTAFVKTSSASNSRKRVRTFNCTAKRRLDYDMTVTGNTFEFPHISEWAFDIIVSICNDPFIGQCATGTSGVDLITEVDRTSLDYAISHVKIHLGSNAVKFNYTFDKKMSFEDTLNLICQSCFIIPYRQANQIKFISDVIKFTGTMLFNHRNILPGSEKRTLSIGPNDTDGIELSYRNYETGLEEIFYLPTDRTASNPKKIRMMGVSDKQVAYWHASREYNKLKYHNYFISFTAMAEAALLRPRDMIMVASTASNDVLTGEVLNISGYTLRLSEKSEVGIGTHTIYVQLNNGIIWSYSIASQGVDEYEVILSTSPSVDISTADDLFMRANYQITTGVDEGELFMIEDREDNGDGTFAIKAVKYDERIYENDGEAIP